MATFDLVISAAGAQRGAQEFVRATVQVEASARRTASTIGQVDRSFGVLNSRIDASGRLAASVRGQFVQLFGVFSAGLAVRNTASFLADYEKALVGVQKASGVTTAELSELRQGFIDLAQTPGIGTRAKELADLATTAGTLGVRGVNNIREFTQVTAQLGNSLRGVSANDVAEAAGRILNITGEGASGIREFGNVIARLEDNVANSAQAILEVGKSVAIATSQFDVSSTDVLGLAAGFADLGITAELARSTTLQSFIAIRDTIADGGAQLELLSRLTGIASGSIEQEFGQNATNVFVRFVAGLKAASDQGVATTDILKEFGLEGLRIDAIIPTLAENVEKFAGSLATARIEASEQSKLLADNSLQAATLNDSYSRFRSTLDAVKDGFSESTGTLKSFVDTSRQVVGIIFGVDAASKDASESTRQLADVIRAAALAAGVLVSFRLAQFFTQAALAATGLGFVLGPIGKAFGLIAGAVAAFEFSKIITQTKEFAVGLAVINGELEILKNQVTAEAAGAGILNLLATPSNLLSELDLNPFFDKTAEATVTIDREALRKDTLKAIQDITDAFNSELPSARVKFDIDPATNAVRDAIASVSKAFDSASAPSAGLAENTAQTAKSVEDARAKLEAVASLLSGIKAISSEELKIVQQARKEEEERVKAIEIAEEARARAVESLTEHRKNLQQEIQLVGLSNDERERTVRLAQFQEDATSAFGANTAETTRQVQEFGAQLEKLQDLRKLEDVANVIGDSFGRALDGVIDKAVEGTLTLQDLGTAFTDLGKDILKGLAQELITKPLVENIKTGVFGALAGDSAGAAAPGAVGTATVTAQTVNLTATNLTGLGGLGGTGNAGTAPISSGQVNSLVSSIGAATNQPAQPAAAPINANLFGPTGSVSQNPATTAGFDNFILNQGGQNASNVPTNSGTGTLGESLSGIGGIGGAVAGIGGVANTAQGLSSGNNAQAGQGIGTLLGLGLGLLVPGIGTILGPLLGGLLGGVVGGAFATGGFVPGSGVTDNTIALTTPGEFIVRREVAQANRQELLELNRNGSMPGRAVTVNQYFPNVRERDSVRLSQRHASQDFLAKQRRLSGRNR